MEENLGEENALRFLQAAINYMSAGKARREIALRRDENFAASFAAFDDALSVGHGAGGGSGPGALGQEVGGTP